MKMTRLVLVRHGQTAWTKEKRYQGSTDIPLSAEGIRSMRKTARDLRRFDFAAIYTSALKRAKQSGRELARQTGIRPQADARLNEMNFGDWEGKTAEYLNVTRNKAFLAWARGKWTTPEGGESLKAFRRRVGGFLRDCLKKHSGRTAAVVSHGGTVRMLLLEALKLGDKHLFSFSADPSSVTILEFSPKGKCRLICMNL